LFGHFKLNSVDHWKKPGKSQVRNSQMVPAESLKKGTRDNYFLFTSSYLGKVPDFSSRPFFNGCEVRT